MVSPNGAGHAGAVGQQLAQRPDHRERWQAATDGNNAVATGALTVASGATLGGSGAVGGAATIQLGGISFARREHWHDHVQQCADAERHHVHGDQPHPADKTGHGQKAAR